MKRHAGQAEFQAALHGRELTGGSGVEESLMPERDLSAEEIEALKRSRMQGLAAVRARAERMAARG